MPSYYACRSFEIAKNDSTSEGTADRGCGGGVLGGMRRAFWPAGVHHPFREIYDLGTYPLPWQLVQPRMTPCVTTVVPAPLQALHRLVLSLEGGDVDVLRNLS